MGLRTRRADPEPPAPACSRRAGYLAGGAQARNRPAAAGCHLQGFPLLGTVAAGPWLEPSHDIQERSIPALLDTAACSPSRVNGDSMIAAHIDDGDVVLMEPRQRAQPAQGPGTIVARPWWKAGAPRSSISTGRGDGAPGKPPTPPKCGAVIEPNRWPCKEAWWRSGAKV